MAFHQNRRDAHDMPGLLFAHLRYHSLRDEKVTRNIRANHQFEVRRHRPLLCRDIEEWVKSKNSMTDAEFHDMMMKGMSN
jgi:hypothetical protein